MDQDLPLKVSHDVSQSLQRKLEGIYNRNLTSTARFADYLLGLGDVERAFVHVDYNDDHDINQEHKPLYEDKKPTRRTLKDILLFRKKEGEDIIREEDRSR